MTQQAYQIREYILNSNLPERAKNEILPLLGVIDSPGVKERILKILEIEGKTLDVEENILNLDVNNSVLPTQEQVTQTNLNNPASAV